VSDLKHIAFDNFRKLSNKNIAFSNFRGSVTKQATVNSDKGIYIAKEHSLEFIVKRIDTLLT